MTDFNGQIQELMRSYDLGLYTWKEVVAKTAGWLVDEPTPELALRALPVALRADVVCLLETVDPGTCVIIGATDEPNARERFAGLVERLARSGAIRRRV